MRYNRNTSPGNADVAEAATALCLSREGLESSSSGESIASSRHPLAIPQTAAEASAPQSSVTGTTSSHTATCRLQESPTEPAGCSATASDQQLTPVDPPALPVARAEAGDVGEIRTAVQHAADHPGVRAAASSISAGAWQDNSQAVASELVQSRQRISQPGPGEEGVSSAQQGMLASPPDSPLQPVQSCNGKRADSVGQGLPVGSGSQDGLHVSTELQSMPDAQPETERRWVSPECQPEFQVCY